MRLMHKRTMDMEINGHEWWSWDGKTVWFDLQTPRSQVFWLAGVEHGRPAGRSRYHVERDWWGVHFNSSRDDTLFASDGGDPSQVAYSTDGMWINLFRVQPDGTLAREKLVDMSQPQLRHRPRRRRAERPHHARQEVGGLHRPVRSRASGTSMRSKSRSGESLPGQPLAKSLTGGTGGQEELFEIALARDSSSGERHVMRSHACSPEALLILSLLLKLLAVAVPSLSHVPEAP